MLTPEQTKKYYATQSKLAKPMSPLQFEKSLKTTTPLGQFNQAPEQEKPTTLGDTEPKGDMAPKTDKTDLGGVIGERAGEKSDRDVLLDRLTSGISGAKDYDPIERRKTLEEERGLPEARERIGSYEQEISKTNELLDSLESDIKARTGEFLIGESQRKRVLASERDPLMKQLGISQRGLGLAESGLERKEGVISDILGREKEEAYRPLDLLKGEMGMMETIDQLFPDQDTDQVGSIIGAIQSGGSEDPLDIYNSLQEQGMDVDINEIVNTIEKIQSVREEVEKDTEMITEKGRQFLIDSNTGDVIKEYGPKDVEIGGGLLLPGAKITPEQLSPLAKSVYDGTIGLSDITASQRATIAPELNAVGYSKAVTGEMKRDVEFIESGMDKLIILWEKVAGRHKGLIQGSYGEWVGTKTDPRVAAFKAQAGIIGMTLTRMFEKGRISDQDRLFYMSLMPNLYMNAKSAKAGASQLKQVLNDRVGQNIQELSGDTKQTKNTVTAPDGQEIIITD